MKRLTHDQEERMAQTGLVLFYAGIILLVGILAITFLPDPATVSQFWADKVVNHGFNR